MIEIRHRQNILDIHPLVIYLLLSDSEYDKYSKNIKRLNKYLGTTLGVFEYECLRRSNTDYEALPEKLGNALMRNNLMVKLLDQQSGSNRYAFACINLDMDGNLVLDAIRNFALDVCSKDIKLLDTHISKQEGEDCITFARIKDILEEALETKAGRGPKWEDHTVRNIRTISHERALPRSSDILACSIPSLGFLNNIGRPASDDEEDESVVEDNIASSISRILKSHNIDSDKRSEISKEICNLIQSTMGIDKKQSDKNAQDLLDGKISAPPVISIELISTIVYRKPKQKYGVRITIGDRDIPMVISQTDQLMLYIAALIRHKVGYTLDLRELYRPFGEPLCARQQNTPLRDWFTDLYNTIVDKDNRDADGWLDKVGDANKKGRPLYQAKSNLNTALAETIGDYSIYKYCELKNESDRYGHPVYTIDIPRENIHLDDKLQKFANRYIDIAPML